jgi:RecA-family ATPase
MKSTLALHLAGALAGGYRFLGHFETDVTQCLIVSEEDSASVIRNRVEAMCRGMGWDERRVLEGICVIARAEARLTSKQWQVHLLSEIEQLQPSLVILDPLAELMTGEENSNSEARGVIQTMRALSAPSGANVLAIHHFGKPAEGKRRIDLFRGASALRSASRFTYALDNDSQAHELTVTCEKLSRSEKLAPFVVRYHIESEPNNRAAWTLARFDYVNAQVATLDRADAFVLEQLQGGERMTTTDLKTAAKGTGVSAVDIAKALKTLEMRRIIDHAEGPKNAKLWGLAEPGRWLP